MISITFEKNGTVSVVGLSTDEKIVELPFEAGVGGQEVPNGSTFFEMDTSNAYMYDGGNHEWRKI